MASLFSLNCSLPIQRPTPSSSSSSQSQPQKVTETSSLSTSTSRSCLKPIVVDGDPPTFVSAPGRRIVAVGDLHGDLCKTRSALEIAGVLRSDGQDIWIGGETVLIQLGDILDRGEDEIAILSLLRSLEIQAKANGGAVFQVHVVSHNKLQGPHGPDLYQNFPTRSILFLYVEVMMGGYSRNPFISINGNHETMNVEGDFRYVDSGAFDECSAFLEHWEDCEHNWEEAFVSWIGVSERLKEDRKMSQSYWGPLNLVKKQKGVIARSILLRQGGLLASELAKHAVALKVDDWIFCHGGLLPHHVSYGIERMNREVSHWMRGLRDSDGYPEIPFIATRGYDSVVWNRLYSGDISDLYEYQIDQIQSVLEKTLEVLGAKAMVVGHTPQPMGANCQFSGRIWRIDVGMSSGVLDSRPEILEIRDNEARVIRSKRDRFSELQVVDYT